MTVIAVRPEMVTWAREYRGLDLASAAKKLAISTDDLSAIEQGQKPVNLTFFKNLSSRLRVPSATLLRRTPPNVPPMPIDFRTLGGKQAILGFETRLAVSYAYTIEQNIIELVEAGAIQRPSPLPLYNLSGDAARNGESERQRIGIPTDIQSQWPTLDAFKNWRTLIERQGIYVILQKFSLEDCYGFTIFRNSDAPIIVINKSIEYVPMRTFTLFHEYAHLLIRQPGISDLRGDSPTESYCNKFAASFLMPQSSLRRILPFWPNEPVEWPFEQIREWAQQLRVSQQTLALRLEHLGVAPIGFFGRLREYQPNYSRKSSGGNYVSTLINELGDHFTSDVLSAEQKKLVLTSEASEMLNLSPRHFNKVRTQIDNQAARLEIGRV